LAFLEEIRKHPEEDQTPLILADWLEENEDYRRAELLRVHLELRASCCQPDRHPERAEQQARLIALLAEGVRPCVPRQKVALGAGLEMEFVWIPPGTFLMGSPPGEAKRQDDETQHRVTLSRGFHLGSCPVTQAQWKAVMGSNPSRLEGDDLPVGGVLWNDCVAFCKRLGKLAGNRFRLPTEAEWEYACRAGSTTPYWFGDRASRGGFLGLGREDVLERYAWYRANSGRQTKPVGQKEPNAWGLFDVHGGVWEWCSDRYLPYPEGDIVDPQVDPQRTPEDEQEFGRDAFDRLDEAFPRVFRGGSWDSYPWQCRAACRSSTSGKVSEVGPFIVPVNALADLGCRVALCQD
jgi:uncharacterized protein (TIGR02996 family)